MLWSDPPDETRSEALRIRELLRRAGVLIAVCASLALILVMV
ncbi:morphogenic membrane protein MmpB [Streptacidiphilus rugosus]|nr:hypothetical protein [Streptacidiphilus rugosus]